MERARRKAYINKYLYQLNTQERRYILSEIVTQIGNSKVTVSTNGDRSSYIAYDNIPDNLLEKIHSFVQNIVQKNQIDYSDVNTNL
jgi:hypothetical protein